MALPDNKVVFYPTSKEAWRHWLSENHANKDFIWVVFYKKNSGIASLTWQEAVEEALCFGWIDSKKVKIDEVTAHQYFSPRKPKSIWSKINKDKVQQLIDDGRMASAGLKSVEIAKANGSWSILDDVDNLIIPDDLNEALSLQPAAMDHFMTYSKSTKKFILYYLLSAKRLETRLKRIESVVSAAAMNKKPPGI